MESSTAQYQLLSLIIPVYNEERTLRTLVEQVLAVKLPYSYRKEIIMVNDGSKDNSWGIMQELQQTYPTEIVALQNEHNLGKTRTVLHGIKESHGDLLIIQDADLEYVPQEIVSMIELLVNKDLDVVYGNRFGQKNKVVYWSNFIGNRFLSTLTSFFTYPRIHAWINDMEVCYKLIKGDIARDIAKTIVSTSSFGFEPEITAKISKYKVSAGDNKRKIRFAEIPISYKPRTAAEGKHIKAISDGMKAIWEVLRFNLGK